MELEEVVGGLSQVSVERRNMDVALKPLYWPNESGSSMAPVVKHQQADNE